MENPLRVQENLEGGERGPAPANRDGDASAGGFCRGSRGYGDLAALLCAALALRLFYLLGLPRVLDTADAVHYIDAARHLSVGAFERVDPNIPMLYPFLVGLAARLMPDYELAGSLVSMAASVLLVIPVYLLARKMHGRASARVAGLAAALWPWLADYGARVGPDALASVLWFSGVYLLSESLRRGGWRLVAADLALFALYLTRPEGLVILLASVPAAFVLSWNERRELGRLIPFVLIALFLLAFHTLYFHSVSGEATAGVRTRNIIRDLDLLQLAATGLKTLCDTLPVMLGPVLLVFLGVGLFHGSRDISGRDGRLEAYVLFFAAVQFTASLFVLSPEPRYVMSVVVALSLWSARGIVLVGEQAARVRYGRYLRLLPAASLVCLMLLGTAATVTAHHLERRSSEPSEYRVAGEWMKKHLAPGLIFTRKPQIGYYAGMRSTGPDLGDTLEEAVARATNAGARYFVVDERYTAAMVPALRPLLDPANAPAPLRFLKDFPEYPHSRIVIYEISAGRTPS